MGSYRAVLWPGKFLTAIGSESARPQFHFGAPIPPVIITSMHHTPWHGARHTAHHLISIHDDCGRGGGEARIAASVRMGMEMSFIGWGGGSG